jgi:hypothetical protein
MSDRPRIRRNDPERSAPIRDWSNMFRSPGAQTVTAPAADAAVVGLQVNNSTTDGVASGSATVSTPATVNASLSEEARIGIETAYRVIDEHLQEGRRAAQAQSGRDGGAGDEAFSTASPSGVGIAADRIQEIVAQGIRFYTSLAPLWGSLVNSIANSAVARDSAAAGGISAAPLAPAPIPRTATATSPAPVIIEIASTRMTRVTVDLAPHVGMSNLAIGGLQALEAEKPPLQEIALATEPGSNRTVLRIRVPEDQPAGVYSGVIVDRESGEPRGTITLRIDA